MNTSQGTVFSGTIRRLLILVGVILAPVLLLAPLGCGGDESEQTADLQTTQGQPAQGRIKADQRSPGQPATGQQTQGGLKSSTAQEPQLVPEPGSASQQQTLRPAQTQPSQTGASPVDQRLEWLTVQLRDPDDDKREDAARDLGRLGDLRAAPGLKTALKDHDDDVRAAAAEALGFIVDLSSVPDLAAVLKDPEKKVRKKAVESLGILESPAAVGHLMLMLGDVSDDVRKETADSLALIGSASAIPALKQAAQNDPDGDVRERASFAIRRIEARK